MDFLDTNVLICAWDAHDPTKQRAARALLAEAVTRETVVSVQVLAEFSVTLLHRNKVRAGQVHTALASLSSFRVVVPDRAMVDRALEAHSRYGVHFYDGMIVAAAERGECTRIFSEDFNAGQRYFGIEVVNPFAT